MSVIQQLNWAVGEPASQRARKLLAVRMQCFFPEKASKTEKIKIVSHGVFFFLKASKRK